MSSIGFTGPLRATKKAFTPRSPPSQGTGHFDPIAAINTSAVMAAIEVWTQVEGRWAQRTDAVRLYPRPLFAQYREESIAAIQKMRPAVLKIWTLDQNTGRWNVEVHNAP